MAFFASVVHQHDLDVAAALRYGRSDIAEQPGPICVVSSISVEAGDALLLKFYPCARQHPRIGLHLWTPLQHLFHGDLAEQRL